MAPPSLENVASSDRREPLDLAAAFAELQNLLLDRPDVTDFLNELAVLAAATVPGTHCGITMRLVSPAVSSARSPVPIIRWPKVWSNRTSWTLDSSMIREVLENSPAS